MTWLVQFAAGKVRDMYAAGDGLLLVVASDRVSAYDVVLPTLIPDKGRVLTALSVWWFERLADLGPHHLVSADLPADLAIPADWRGRAVLVRRLEMLPVECVARGYLAGSGVAAYRATGAVRGVEPPSGLVDGSRLPEPVFTPTTKAPVGTHDEAMTYAQGRPGRRGPGRRAARPDAGRLPAAAGTAAERGISCSRTPNSSSAWMRPAC